MISGTLFFSTIDRANSSTLLFDLYKGRKANNFTINKDKIKDSKTNAKSLKI